MLKPTFKTLNTIGLNTLAFGTLLMTACTNAGVHSQMYSPVASTSPTFSPTTKSAVQVRTLTQGSGPYITPNDEIEMRFHSYLLDGTPLDGTMNNVPVILPVSQMFGGLQQALTQMQAGGKYSVHIPANVGFSEEGKAHKQAVNYEIEILRVNP